MKLFVVYDSAASAYSPPMAYMSNGEALREFIDAAKNPQTKIGKHPSDFSLFELGEFDQISANINTLASPVRLGSAHEFLGSSLGV